MKNILFIIFCFVCIGNVSLAQSNLIPTKADELLTAYSDQKKFSGSVLIAREGSIIFHKAYGSADLSTNTPNTIQTEYRAGSLTKMFTSTAILQLVESGKLSLTDPISKFVPAIKNGQNIQLRHLLSHTSGIRGTTPGPEATTLAQLVAQFKSEEPAFTPGERFEYNNFNYMLLSYVAEKVSGKELSQLLPEKIFQKTGMLQTGLDEPKRNSDNKALGYVSNPATASWERTDNRNVALASGAGALYTTTGDLLKWAEVIASRQLLQETTWNQAFSPVQGDYGLGWIIQNTDGRMSVGHTGSIEGFIANFITYPKERITIIYLSNYQDTDGRQLAEDLKAIVFDKPYTLPKIKKTISLSAEAVQKYAGTYQLNEHFKVSVFVEGNKVYALAPGDQEKTEFTPESENKFYIKGPETEIEFIMENGKVVAMFINMQGGQKLMKVS